MTTKPRETQRPTADRGTVVALVVGILGIVLAVLVPFAPVLADTTRVTWPEEGQPAESTTAFFVPYEPESLTLDAPCPVLRAAQESDGGTTVMSTHLPGRATTGLVVTVAGDQLRVLVDGREVYSEPVAGGPNCGLTVDADANGTVLRVAGDTVRFPERHVREIFAFSTDLAPEDTGGMQVRATTSTWFESVPTPSKTVLLVLHAALVIVSLVLLGLADRRRRVSRRKRRIGLRPWPFDAGMVLVLGWWLVLGPTTPDDSFAAMTLRQGLENGDVSNYYRWANSSESPFNLFQRVLEPWALFSEHPLWMRAPSVLTVLLIWLLLSRMLLPDLLPSTARSRWVQLLTAVTLLAWWMPFGMGLRPEPLAALGVTATLTFLLHGVTHRRLLPLGWGAFTAGLSLAVSPSAITGLAAIIVLAPRMIRLIRGTAAGPLLARLALGGCIASAGLVVMFADQTWFGVHRATDLHQFFGPNVAWFEEIQRYESLFSFDLQGGVTRRVAVLTTVALALTVAPLVARGSLPRLRAAAVPASCFALGLVLLVAAPSKWTHYFGTLAGVGTATIVTSIVLLWTAARHRRHRQTLLVGAIGIGATILAASLSYSGENRWFLHSQYGMPWGEQPVRPLNSPLFWLLVITVVVLLARNRRGALVRAPAIVATSTLALSLVLMLFSFTVAPLRQAGSYSIGGQMLQTLRGGSCGLVDKIDVLSDAENGVLRLREEPEEDEPAGQGEGFSRGEGYDEDYAAPAEPGSGSARYLWGSLADGQISTGSFTTDEFVLPDLGERQELAVSVAGRTGDGNRLVMEFAGPDGPLGQRVLDDAYTDDDERPQYPTDRVEQDEPQDTPSWRTLPVDRSAIPDGADRLRLRAEDATTDAGGWLAFTGPRIRDLQPMKEFLDERPGPVFVDWSILWSTPCLQNRLARVGDGLVEPPRLLLAPAGALGFSGDASFATGIGGVFAGLEELGARRDVTTRLQGSLSRPQNTTWGVLQVTDYPIATSAYDRTTSQRWQWGWQGPKSVLLSEPPT